MKWNLWQYRNRHRPQRTQSDPLPTRQKGLRSDKGKKQEKNQEK